MAPRLVITGMGAVTPLGMGVDEHWHALVTGKSGIDYISKFDTDSLPVKIAAEVKAFEASALLPRNILKSSTPFMQYAWLAAEEAFRQANLESLDPAGIGICMGTALAGAPELIISGAGFPGKASGKVSPHLVPKVLGNIAATHFAIAHNLTGPSLTLSTACSAGGDAVLAGALLLLAGEANVIIVMAGESILNPVIISSLACAKALSRNNEHPQMASRPFDLERDGFVIGEGGGAIVIETEESALDRNAEILAVLSGWANTMDGYHITAPDPEGHGAARCMRLALKRAGLEPNQIDYINAHGTSTQLGDYAETLAIKQVFGGLGKYPPISSTKGATGHLMGAGGLIEIITCIRCIDEGILPPTLNLDHPDPQCDLDYVPDLGRHHIVNHAMSNSLGFGGQNSSIILSRYS